MLIKWTEKFRNREIFDTRSMIRFTNRRVFDDEIGPKPGDVRPGDVSEVTEYFGKMAISAGYATEEKPAPKPKGVAKAEKAEKVKEE